MGKHDRLMMDFAYRAAEESHDPTHKVGCVIVTPDQQMTLGWNGTPSGTDNNTEYPVMCRHECGSLYMKMRTKPTVMHAELNALSKFAGSTASAADGSLFVTLSPCLPCALQTYRSRIRRVVYDTLYKDEQGIEFLLERGLAVERI